MRRNTAPFAPDSRSASGNVAATNGKVSRAFRRERERRSSTTGSGSRRNAPRTASCWDRGALLLRRRTQTLRPGHGRNPNDLGRLSFASGARSRARSAMRTRSPVQSWSGTRGSVYRPSPSDRVDVVGGVQQAPRRTETRAAAAAMGPTRGDSSTASSARSSPSPGRCIRERWASPVWRRLVVVAPAPTCSGEEGATSARRRQRV